MNRTLLFVSVALVGLISSCNGNDASSPDSNNNATPSNLAKAPIADHCAADCASVKVECAISPACSRARHDACLEGCKSDCTNMDELVGGDSTGTPSCNTNHQAIVRDCAPTTRCTSSQKDASHSGCNSCPLP